MYSVPFVCIPYFTYNTETFFSTFAFAQNLYIHAEVAFMLMFMDK